MVNALLLELPCVDGTLYYLYGAAGIMGGASIQTALFKVP